MDEVPERDEIDEFFNTYDKDADGRVTFEEILAADSEVGVTSTAHARSLSEQNACTHVAHAHPTARCRAPRAHP